jgi:hypothetical protein
VDDVIIDKLVAMGCVSVADIDEIGPDPLVENLGVAPEMVEKILYECGEEVIRLEEQKEEEAKQKALAAAEAAKNPPPAPKVEGEAPADDVSGTPASAFVEDVVTSPVAEASPTEGEPALTEPADAGMAAEISPEVPANAEEPRPASV